MPPSDTPLDHTPPDKQEPRGESAGMVPTPLVPTQWLPDPFPGEYRIRRLLGQGAFGKVWLADDLNLGGRPVALKTLRLDAVTAAAAGADAAPAALAALRREAALLGRLRHPNVVQVHAWRQAGDEHYLVEQYVPGPSLADRLQQEGPLPWQLAARYAADVGDGLLEVHAHGIVHRDIKPANILWDSEKDEAVLTDFGISVRLGEARDVSGTLPFMAPEALRGSVAPGMDVYSLAAALFCLVTGEVPFRTSPGLVAREKIGELLGLIERGLPAPEPRCRGLPEALEALLRAGLTAAAERPKLPDFVTALRGTLNRLLVDTLPPMAPASEPATVRLQVSRQVGAGTWQALAASHPAAGWRSRDLKKVPRPPEQVGLRTGDRVRVEVAAARDGFVMVFNVGPTGNLNLLWPEQPPGSAVVAGRPLEVLDVELTPPAGRERLFALWSRDPLPLRPHDLLGLISEGEAGGRRPYVATRDLKRVKESVQGLPAQEWCAVVLELDHRPA
jgi:serine/threonine protein kinase